MRCPYCGASESKVLDSRASSGGSVIRRRRECLACGRRFTTKEFVEEAPLMVIKGDGRRELFERDKVRLGVLLACKKRPIPTETIESVVDRVEVTLRDNHRLEVSALEIGQAVMEALRELDEVAYVRFASVYRKFQDKEEFLNELKSLDKRTK